jgi:hypothetical protein
LKKKEEKKRRCQQDLNLRPQCGTDNVNIVQVCRLNDSAIAALIVHLSFNNPEDKNTLALLS